MLVIGLDAASQLDKFGYAIGKIAGDQIEVHKAGLVGNEAGLALISSEIGKSQSTLIAIDAPLGWPEPLGRSLAQHRAGQFLAEPKDTLFRRQTDLAIRKITRKNPLEVGADRIARAAHSALSVLATLRRLSGKPLPLLWEPQESSEGVIEVYPAATLAAHDLASTGYKSKNKQASAEEMKARGAICSAFESRFPGLPKFMRESADVFDACLCLISASDFLSNRCVRPTAAQRPLAEKESWIWVRAPSKFQS